MVKDYGRGTGMSFNNMEQKAKKLEILMIITLKFYHPGNLM